MLDRAIRLSGKLGAPISRVAVLAQAASLQRRRSE